MADNAAIDPGSSPTVSVATDEVSYSGNTTHVQLMRPVLTTGAEGSRTVVELTGDNSNGLDVDVTRVSGNVTVVQGTGTNLHTVVDSGTVAATQSGTWNVANVSGTVSLPTGAATSAKQDTIIGHLDGVEGSLTTLAGAVSGAEVQVDVLTMPTTTVQATNLDIRDLTSASDSVAAAQSGTWNITNVSGTVSLPTGAATAANQATIIGHLDGVEGSLTTLAGAVAGSEVQVDVVSLPTVTVNAHAVTNAGTFAVQESGGALTALQLIDDVVATEDAAHSSGDKGVMALAVRRDANTTLADTTGDYAPLQVDSSGSLKVAIVSGAGSGGTSATDDAAFSVASGSGTPIMGLADEAAPDSVDEGDVGVVRMTLTRALHVNLRDASGNELSVGGGTQYDEDAAHSTGSKVTGCGIVRKDAAASLAGSDGDYTLPIADANGRLWVNASGVTLTVDGSGVTQPISHAALTELAAAIDTELQVDVVGSLPAGTNNIGDVDVLSVVPGTGATSLGKAEDAAHSSGDVGVMALSVRQDTAAALGGTDADYQPLITDASGRLHVNVGTSALPSGAATSANQSTIIGHVDGIEGLLGTIDADTGNISTKIDTLAGAVSGTEVQVDVLTMPTTTVQATNLDIRDLAQSSDNVRVYANTAKDGSGTAYIPLVDADGHLQIDVLSGGGGGTQYTEGDTDSSITGTAILWEDASETLRAVSASKPLPVDLQDATVAVTQSGTWNVTNVSGTVSLPTGASTLSEQQSQTTHLATIAGDTTAVQAAVELIDDAVFAEDSAASAGDKGLAILAVRRDADTTLVGADNDYANLQVNANGALKVEIFDGGDSHTVDGTVTANQGGTWVLGSNSGVDIGDVTINNASGGSAVNIQDGGNSITVDGTVAATQSGTWNVTNVSGTVSLPTGASTLAEQQTQTTALQLLDNLVLAEDAAHASGDAGVQALAVRKAAPANLSGADGDYEPLQISAGRLWASATIDAALPAGSNAIGKLAANDGVDIGDVTINNATLAVTQSGTWTVQPGNTANTTAWLVKEQRASTATASQVSDTSSSTTILASNSSRLGATVYNDSSALLYLLLGSGTASSTNYTARLYPNGYYEVPGCYTGAIVGIWASDPNDGAARVTELT